MIKFEIIDINNGGYYLYMNSESILISIGNIVLKKQNDRSTSCCIENEDDFDYHEIENALCGKIFFTPKRITVIQMK